MLLHTEEAGIITKRALKTSRLDRLSVSASIDTTLFGIVRVNADVPAIYPPQDARRSSDTAPGCPDFGDDSVVDRGPKGVPPSGGSLHPPVGDRPEIVWWDPAVLTRDVEEDVSLRQQRILKADPEGHCLHCKRGKLCPLEICPRRGHRLGIAAVHLGPDSDLSITRRG